MRILYHVLLYHTQNNKSRSRYFSQRKTMDVNTDPESCTRVLYALQQARSIHQNEEIDVQIVAASVTEPSTYVYDVVLHSRRQPSPCCPCCLDKESLVASEKLRIYYKEDVSATNKPDVTIRRVDTAFIV